MPGLSRTMTRATLDSVQTPSPEPEPNVPNIPHPPVTPQHPQPLASTSTPPATIDSDSNSNAHDSPSPDPTEPDEDNGEYAQNRFMRFRCHGVKTRDYAVDDPAELAVDSTGGVVHLPKPLKSLFSPWEGIVAHDYWLAKESKDIIRVHLGLLPLIASPLFNLLSSSSQQGALGDLAGLSIDALSRKSGEHGPSPAEKVNMLKRFFPSALLEPGKEKQKEWFGAVALLDWEEVKTMVLPRLLEVLNGKRRSSKAKAKAKGKGKMKEEVPNEDEGEEDQYEWLRRPPEPDTIEGRMIRERNGILKKIVELRKSAAEMLSEVYNPVQDDEQEGVQTRRKRATQTRKIKRTQVNIDFLRNEITNTLIKQLDAEDRQRSLDFRKRKTDPLKTPIDPELVPLVRKSRRDWIEEMLGDPEGELRRFLCDRLRLRNDGQRLPTRKVVGKRKILPSDLFHIPSSTASSSSSKTLDPDSDLIPLYLFATFTLPGKARRVPIPGELTAKLVSIRWISPEERDKRWLPMDLQAYNKYLKARRNLHDGNGPLLDFKITNAEGKDWKQYMGKSAPKARDEDAMDADEEEDSKYPLPPTENQRKHLVKSLLTMKGFQVVDNYNVMHSLVRKNPSWGAGEDDVSSEEEEEIEDVLSSAEGAVVVEEDTTDPSDYEAALRAARAGKARDTSGSGERSPKRRRDEDEDEVDEADSANTRATKKRHVSITTFVAGPSQFYAAGSSSQASSSEKNQFTLHRSPTRSLTPTDSDDSADTLVLDDQPEQNQPIISRSSQAAMMGSSMELGGRGLVRTATLFGSDF